MSHNYCSRVILKPGIFVYVICFVDLVDLDVHSEIIVFEKYFFSFSSKLVVLSRYS